MMISIFRMHTIGACIILHVILVFASTSDSPITKDSLYETRLHWANRAFEYMKAINCSTVFFTSQQECQHLQTVEKRNVAVYIAQHSDTSSTGFAAMLPDGMLTRGTTYHGVIALDPYPNANFGHLVVVFFVEISPRSVCERHQGQYIGSQECLKFGLKHRCKNALERRLRRHEKNNHSERVLKKMVRRCEINFLPLVYPDTEKTTASLETTNHGHSQHLLCREDLKDYSPCPVLRPANETFELICNPLRDNTRRCETSHEALGGNCQMFENCDQAILISGGWNRQTSMLRHKENVINMYNVLRRNGFRQSSIKIFYANGMHGGIKEESDQTNVNTAVLPAAMKTSMRLYISKLCGTPLCVDTFVIYLNSPTKPDGTMLLWDVNKDGRADESEMYTVDELVKDLTNCKARSVQIIADQSFSGEITRAVRKAQNLPNVIAYASSKEHEYSYESDFTDQWTGVDHSYQCTQTVFQNAKNNMASSNPETSTRNNRHSEGPGHVTIFGAPCAMDPPLTQDELRLFYRGCQNVPTDVWLRTYFSRLNSDVLSDSPYSEAGMDFNSPSTAVRNLSDQVLHSSMDYLETDLHDHDK